MRQGLRTILELEPGFQVVGEAADREEAITRYNEFIIVQYIIKPPGERF